MIWATYLGDTKFVGSTGTLSQTVVGPVSLSELTVTVSSASITVNGTDTVTLTARDGSGDQEFTGGLKVSFALAKGSAGGKFSAVTDHGNGTYTATFTGTNVGSDTITATIGGKAVTSTRPTVTVVSGADTLSQATFTTAAFRPRSRNNVSSNDFATDAALRALLLDDSAVTVKLRPLFEP